MPDEHEAFSLIRDSLARIERRLEAIPRAQGERCERQDRRIARLEQWQNRLIGAWLVLQVELGIAVALITARGKV